MNRFVIVADDPRAPDVVALLEAHLAFARDHTPPKDVHALRVEALAAPNVQLFSVRENGRLLGVGALRHLEAGHIEIKSMHTDEQARHRGVGRALLDHLITVATDGGYHRISLETGTMPAFAPARALYASAGFEECAPFADYPGGPNSVCMTRELVR